VQDIGWLPDGTAASRSLTPEGQKKGMEIARKLCLGNYAHINNEWQTMISRPLIGEFCGRTSMT
jgi:hypothetical protein